MNGYCFLLVYFLYISHHECHSGEDEDGEETTTSAVVLDSTSPVPTTIFGRINVEQEDDRVSHADIDSITARRAKISKGQSLWKWDEWCQYQPQVGTCSENITRYYYNYALETCLTFPYSGCNPNKNNFETILDCERYCKGSGYILENDVVRPAFCSFQPDSGMCLSFLTKYYYDINDKICKKFVYGGCGGNYNRFDTLLRCAAACKAG